jgi:hypothetical protein
MFDPPKQTYCHSPVEFAFFTVSAEESLTTDNSNATDESNASVLSKLSVVKE